MRPKVLFVLNASGGGATQGIREYLRFQNHRDIDAFLALPETPNLTQQEWMKAYAKGIKVLQLSWWNLPNGLPWYYSWALYLKGLMKSNFRRFSTKKLVAYAKEIEATHIYTGSVLIKEGALAAKALGLPHYWHIKETFGSRGRVQFPLGDLALERFILGHSTKVICMTNYIKSFFSQNPTDNRLIIISDGINPEDFDNYPLEKRESLRASWGVQPQEILVGMVASLSSIWKNHKTFIKALDLINKKHPVKFIAFGTPPKAYSNRFYNAPFNYFQTLEDLLSKSTVSDKFIWPGFVNDVPGIFNAIDIFVHPCEIEPFGRVTIEAMAAKRVVIVPDEGGSSEPVSNGETGYYFKANQYRSLAEQVNTVLENYGQSQETALNAQNKMRSSSYTLKEYSNKMKELFYG